MRTPLTHRTVQPTILLVEDDSAEIARVMQACAQCGRVVVLEVVSDGEAALAWFLLHAKSKKTLPQMVVFDLKLPKLAGLAALRHLRMNPKVADLPIIVYSQTHEPAEVLLSYQAGANRFVNKPTDSEQYALLLTELLDYWLQPHQRKLDFADEIKEI